MGCRLPYVERGVLCVFRLCLPMEYAGFFEPVVDDEFGAGSWSTCVYTIGLSIIFRHMHASL